MARRNSQPRTSWDPLADWYDGWVGKTGSLYHRQVAIPLLLSLLRPQPGEAILDIGCGQGVLAPYISEKEAEYSGVDASNRLIQQARRYHPNAGRFQTGDARRLEHIGGLKRPGSYDAATFLLSIQDMDPLPDVIRSAAAMLKSDGRLVIVMLHPCFRIPRQSGWGFDDGRKLTYRRIDSYMSQLDVPLKSYRDRDGEQRKTRSFHRPLNVYVKELVRNDLLLAGLKEATAENVNPSGKPIARPLRRALQEIPMFLGLLGVVQRSRSDG